MSKRDTSIGAWNCPMTSSYENKFSLLNRSLITSSMQRSTERLKTTCSNFRSFEGCHNADMCSGISTKILEGKKKAKEDDKAKKPVAKTGIDSPTASTIETNMTKTDMVIGLMRSIIKMIASTIAILHAKTTRTVIATEMTNLIMMTKARPRLRKSRIAKVATMPTMLKRTTREILALSLVALTLPPRRSKEFECHPPREHSLTVPLQVTRKKTTTLNREKHPPMLVPRNQFNGEGNPWLLLQHPLNAPAPLFLPPRRTRMVGLGSLLQRISFLERNLSLHWNQQAMNTQ
jgi:hypothetical protein